ncbi:hypothetical protein U1Q18_032670 [Sarracenia purpurea var. burkii]
MNGEATQALEKRSASSPVRGFSSSPPLSAPVSSPTPTVEVEEIDEEEESVSAEGEGSEERAEVIGVFASVTVGENEDHSGSIVDVSIIPENETGSKKISSSDLSPEISEQESKTGDYWRKGHCSPKRNMQLFAGVWFFVEIVAALKSVASAHKVLDVENWQFELRHVISTHSPCLESMSHAGAAIFWDSLGAETSGLVLNAN